MFSKAYRIASNFTFPIILSRMDSAGKCSSSVGTFILINDEGWIATAFHLTKQFTDLVHADGEARKNEAAEAAINADVSLSNSERKRRLATVPRLLPDQTKRGAGFWGHPQAKLVTWHGIEAVDFAVGKLEPFDPAWFKSTYPVFKDPSKDFDRGTALCKLGYPFPNLATTYNTVTDSFDIKASVLSRFPIDGILTRIANVPQPAGAAKPPFPLKWVETSTPGLRGQSGGPTFDTQGTVWGVQVRTAHLTLGFDPPVPNGKKGEKEHQFLNVGLGVHPETMFGLFNDKKIKFTMSAY